MLISWEMSSYQWEWPFCYSTKTWCPYAKRAGTISLGHVNGVLPSLKLLPQQRMVLYEQDSLTNYYEETLCRVDEESLLVKCLLSAHLLKQNHIHSKLFQIFTPQKDLNWGSSGNLGLAVGCHLAASPNSQSGPIMGPQFLPKLNKRILETSCPGFIWGTLGCLPKGVESMLTLEARKEDLRRPGGGVPLLLSAHVQLTIWFPDQQSPVFSSILVSTMLL